MYGHRASQKHSYYFEPVNYAVSKNLYNYKCIKSLIRCCDEAVEIVSLFLNLLGVMVIYI